MKCEIKKTRGVTLFKVQGNIVFNRITDIRETVLGEIVRSPNGKFLIDIGDAQLLDSAGVGFIVSVYKTAASCNGKFAIVRPNGDVKTMLRTVGLVPRLFNIYESEDEAIKAI